MEYCLGLLVDFLVGAEETETQPAIVARLVRANGALLQQHVAIYLVVKFAWEVKEVDWHAGRVGGLVDWMEVERLCPVRSGS